MQWRDKAYERKLAKREIERRIYDWHPWFAWRPVRVHMKVVWLEQIQRREKGFWDYRLPENAYPVGCCRGTRCSDITVQRCLDVQRSRN